MTKELKGEIYNWRDKFPWSPFGLEDELVEVELTNRRDSKICRANYFSREK